MDMLSETKKRQAPESDMNEMMETPKNQMRTSGNATTCYLREKNEKEHALRQEELKLKQRELELNMKRQESYETQAKQLAEQSQQQSQALMLLITKIEEKF